MEIWRRLFGREDPQEQQERLARHQREEEDLVRSSLVRMYTHRESVLHATTAVSQQMLPPGSHEELRRMFYDIDTTTQKGTEQILAAGEDQLLSIIADPEKRRTIHTEALTSARAYWEQTLEQPDNSTDVTMMGRRRLTQISQKLESLENPPPDTTIHGMG